MNNEILIQLYREDNIGSEGYLTLSKDADMPFGISLSDILDPSKRTSTISKSIRVGGTKENNNIIGHYYDVNVISRRFDKNEIQKCRVLINGEIFYDNCNIQLIDIEKVQPNSSYEWNIEYIFQIKSEVGNFFDVIKNKLLTDIEFSTIDIPNNADPLYFLYNPTFVDNSSTNDYTDGYMFSPQHTGFTNNHTLPNYKPNIFLWQYWNRIIKDAGYRWNFEEIGVENSILTDPSRDDLHFRKLLVPFTDKLGSDTYDNVLFYNSEAEMGATHSPFLLTGVTQSAQPASNNNGRIHLSGDKLLVPNDVEIFDYSSSYNPSNSSYTSNFTGFLDINVYSEYEAYFRNGNAYAIKVVGDISGGSYAKIKVDNRVYKNGILTSNYFRQGGDANIIDGTVFGTASRTYIDNSTADNLIQVPVNPGDVITVRSNVYVEQPNNGQWGEYRLRNNLTNALVPSNFRCEIDILYQRINFNVRIGNGGLNFGGLIDMNNYIPQKIKQGDFIKSILNLHNIILTVDNVDNNLLNFYTRDYFYDNGDIKKWQSKICKEKEQTTNFISDLTEKEKLFTYKNDKDVNNVAYIEEFNDTYGSARFRFDNKNIKGESKIEVIFSPSPIIKDNDRYITDLSTAGSLRLLYYGGVGSTTLNIMDWSGNVATTLNTYPILTHLDNPDQPNYDINFGVCGKYYWNFNSITNNNLLNNYWRRTLHQINNSRLVTLYMNLTERDIRDLKLNDIIYLEETYYYINKIIDFNPAKTYITKVELVNIDDMQSLGVIKPIGPIKPTKPVLPVRDGLNPLLNPDRNGNVITTIGGISGNPDTITGFGQGNNLNEFTSNFGNGNSSKGIGTMMVGDNNYSEGNGQKIIGSDVYAIGEGSTIIGKGTTAIGTGIYSIGDNSNIESGGIYFGNDIIVPDGVRNSIVVGDNITATQSGVYTDNLVVVGGGSITGIGLPAVLADDNETDGNNIIFSVGDRLESASGTNYINLNSGSFITINGSVKGNYFELDNGMLISSGGLQVDSPTSQFGDGSVGYVIISDDFYGGELGLITSDDEVIATKHSDGSFRYGGGTPGGGEPLIIDSTGKANFKGDVNLDSLVSATPITSLALDAAGNVVDGNALAGAGIISDTYANLVTLMAGYDLIPGKFYLMTDYQTIYDQPDYSSPGVAKGTVTTKTASVDPILLLATSTSEFAKEVWRPSTPQHKLEYDITFNTTEYMSATAKGRITYCKDEYNNETGYDHTVVLLKRYETINGSGVYDSYWDTGFGSTEVNTFTMFPSVCYDNIIPAITDLSGFLFYINNNTFGSFCGGNTFGTDCYNNTFRTNCDNNTFGNTCYNNSFGSDCNSNTFGSVCYNNTIGSSCDSNTFGSVCYNNTFGTNCGGNTFGSVCYNNTIGSSSGTITFGTKCYNNTFGTNCYNNTFGNDCGGNSFGNSCSSNSFGNGCDNNSFGNGCGSNSFGSNCDSNTFGANATNNNFASNSSSTNYTSATHVYYTTYTCEIFKRQDGSQRLRYWNNSDVMVVVAANA